MVGERTNANGSKAFREAMLAADWDTCVAMARDQVKEGSHLIDVCVDYTGADGVSDMTEVASRLCTQSSVPLMVDSTEGPVVRAALEWIGGRPILNSVNLEEGDEPGTRLDTFLRLAREFGAAVVCTCIDEEGQARTAEWKVRAARNIRDIAVERYGLAPEDLLFDPLALPLSTGMEESRQDGIETIEGIRRIKAELPGVSTILGLSNVSFGLNPAARQVLNSVFLHECVEAGLDSAIVHTSKILPLSRIDERAKEVCLDLVYDRRADGYDPLQELLALFEGATVSAGAADEHLDWPVDRRLAQRIIDGNRNGLEADLTEALESGTEALAIVNDILLEGMKVVGERFASGEMQLPFVLQSAETMKAAVAFLEPHMEKSDQGGKGTVVLATVKGDVHDIGKNLVDIILTNNGYEVVNLGIKVGINELIAAAEEHAADAIGMSGLLVKSTLIMRENLVELNDRSLADIPVLLGGAALTRTYVERDLREVYQGRLFYGRDAFEGLRTMDRLVELKRTGEDDPDFGREISERNVPRRSRLDDQDTAPVEGQPPRADVAADNPLFTPPFVGSRVAVGIPIDEIAEYLNLTALFRNQWGFRPEGGENDAEFKDRVKATLREQLGKAKEADLLVPSVAYGHFAANAEGNDLVIWKDESRSSEWMRFTFPRQRKEPWLCIADFFRPTESGDEDFASFMLCTIGARASEETARLFAEDEYQSYLFLHGLSVEMAEATAEYWHRRIRQELGFAVEDGPTLTGLFRQQYRGGRYSWGYPACPDLTDNAEGRGAAGRGTHRRHGQRGVPAEPRTDHRRHHLPPPRGQVLRRVSAGRAPTGVRGRRLGLPRPVHRRGARCRGRRGCPLWDRGCRWAQRRRRHVDGWAPDRRLRARPPGRRRRALTMPAGSSAERLSFSSAARPTPLASPGPTAVGSPGHTRAARWPVPAGGPTRRNRPRRGSRWLLSGGRSWPSPCSPQPWRLRSCCAATGTGRTPRRRRFHPGQTACRRVRNGPATQPR